MTNSEENSTEPTLIPLSRVAWLFLLMLFAGLIWRFYSMEDYLAAAVVGTMLVMGLNGYRVGLLRIVAAVVSFAIAFAIAPSLGTSCELWFAQQFGTSGSLNRIISTAAVGLLVIVVCRLAFSLVAMAAFRNRPTLASSNRWLGCVLGIGQGAFVMLLVLGGLVAIDKQMTAISGGNRVVMVGGQNLTDVVRKATQMTRKSSVGPLVTKYNLLTRIPTFNELATHQDKLSRVRHRMRD